MEKRDPRGTVQLRVRRLGTMKSSYVGWGLREPSVEDGAPGDKEGVPSEAARQGGVPKRTGRGFCTTLRDSLVQAGRPRRMRRASW